MLTVILADKTLKKDIKRFYKHNHSSFSFKGLDDTFLIYEDNQIIASAIVSQLTVTNLQFLLHGVLTHQSYRKQGLANKLLKFIEAHYRSHSKQNSPFTLHCFVLPELVGLYQKHGYQVTFEGVLNEVLHPRFIAYKRMKPTLVAMAMSL